MPLTDVACRKATCPPDRARKRFADRDGLYLEVLPAGGKYWRLKFRVGGREKRLAMGVYPTVTLETARAKCREARAQLAAGEDPAALKQVKKAAARAPGATTFEAVARAWHEHWQSQRSNHHAAYVLRRLEADVFPWIGEVPITEISASKLVTIAKRIEKRGALDIAKRALQTCGQILRYAVAHGYIERNPGADVKPGDVLQGRLRQNYARLDAKELPDLLRKMQVYDGSPYTRAALQLIALTFVRTSELIEAVWPEFDLEAAEWRIPAERMKMRTPHIVPLSRQAVDVLRCLLELQGVSERVFPGDRDPAKPMSNNTILKALDRMGFKHRMTGHGFRGVASTILHEQGFEHVHIELQLAHQERNAVSAAYNHALYLRERRKMMQAWADHLDAIRQGARTIPKAA